MLKMTVYDILVQTMFDLLNKKSIDKIQVKDILDYSGVSKTSFYRLFNDKYDLRNACYAANINPILTIIDNAGWKHVLLGQFEYFYKGRTFLLNGISDNPADSISGFILNFANDFYLTQIRRKMKRNNLSRREEDLAVFYAAGCVQILFKWLQSGSKESPEEMAQELYDFMPEELKQIMP